MRERIVVALELGMLVVAACTPLHADGPGAGSQVACPDGTHRLAVGCDSVAQLKTRIFAVNAGLPKLGLGLSAAHEQRAIEQVSAATQQLALELDAKCAQYNACALDAATWWASEERLRQHVRLVQQLVSTGASARAGDAVWQNALPAQASERLTLRLQVLARAGGGAYHPHPSGAPLASGDQLRFVLQTSVPAHVYVLLLSSQGRAEQLFPAVGASAALAPGVQVQVPPAGAGAFVLDEAVGTEHLQIVASRAPLRDLEARLAALASARGAPESAPVLQAIGSLLCSPLQAAPAQATLDATSVTCKRRRTRGIVYEPAAGPAATPLQPELVLAAEPGDDVVVLQHRVQHVAALPPVRTSSRGEPHDNAP